MVLSQDLMDLRVKISELGVKSKGKPDVLGYQDELFVNLNYDLPKTYRKSMMQILDSLGYWGKTQYQTIGVKTKRVLYQSTKDLDIEFNLERDFIELRFDGVVLDTKFSDFETKREALAIGEGGISGSYLIANKIDYLNVLNYKRGVESYLESLGFHFLMPIDVVHLAKSSEKGDLVAFSEEMGFSYLLVILGRHGWFR